MKVFRIKADVNNYQWIMPDVPESELLNFRFDCTPQLENWKPPDVFAFNPLKKKGDFLHFGWMLYLPIPEQLKLLEHFLRWQANYYRFFMMEKNIPCLMFLNASMLWTIKERKKQPG